MTQYEFSLQQEVLLEKGAAVLGDLFRYEWEKGLSAVNDLDHPVIAMHDLIWSAKANILCAKTELDLARIEAQFDFAKDCLKKIEADIYAR